MSGLSTYAVLCNGVIVSKLAMLAAERDSVRDRVNIKLLPSGVINAGGVYWERCIGVYLDAIDQLCYAVIIHSVVHPRNFRRQWEKEIRGVREDYSAHFCEELPEHNYSWIAEIIAVWDQQDAEEEALKSDGGQ